MNLEDRPLNQFFHHVDNGEIRQNLEILLERHIAQLAQFMQVGGLSDAQRNLTLCKICAKIASTIELAREFKSTETQEFFDNLGS